MSDIDALCADSVYQAVEELERIRLTAALEAAQAAYNAADAAYTEAAQRRFNALLDLGDAKRALRRAEDEARA